jgi:DNA-binding NtrC family response regulator
MGSGAAQRHDACSPRHAQPFAVINCAALNASLVEAELFGCEKGVFPAVDRPRPGKFAAAARGTLLFLEVDALSLDQQAKLLPAIRTGEYEPVGSNETWHSTARIILESNCDLEKKVEQGEFSEDLCYRVNVMAFHLPPLRERRQDIAPLAHTFLKQIVARNGEQVTGIGPEAMGTMERYNWPGNIRELRNVIARAVSLSEGPALTPALLPEALRTKFAY